MQQVLPFKKLPPMTVATQDLFVYLDRPDAEHILQKLELNLTSTRLHIFCTANKESISLLPRLNGCSSVRFVHVKAEYLTADECRELCQPLKRVLISCPNLRHLVLNISLPRTGCVVPDVRLENFGFDFSNDERLPPLESLEILAYPWRRKRINSTIATHATGYHENEEELDYWAETFDWSHLRQFSDHTSDLAMRIALRLTALEEVALYSGYDKFALRSFFLKVPSTLSAIAIPYLQDVGVDAILRHKNMLCKLHIHNPNLFYKPGAQELLELRDSLNNLTDLSLDIDRDDDIWPYPLLDLIASFPKLHRLELWFELGQSSNAPARPYLTASSAQHLSEYMHEHCATLQSLILHSGCPPQPSLGYPTDEVLWRAGNSTSFTCDMTNSTSSKLTLTCLKLDSKQNQNIQAYTNFGKHKINHFPKGQNVAFRVAVDGPLPMKDWMMLDRKDQ